MVGHKTPVIAVQHVGIERGWGGMKLQSFGHVMQRTDTFEKTLVLGKIDGGRRRGRQRMK